jgi:hypothetical protein
MFCRSIWNIILVSVATKKYKNQELDDYNATAIGGPQQYYPLIIII